MKNLPCFCPALFNDGGTTRSTTTTRRSDGTFYTAQRHSGRHGVDPVREAPGEPVVDATGGGFRTKDERG